MIKYAVYKWEYLDTRNGKILIYGMFKIGEIVEAVVIPNERYIVLHSMNNGDLGWKWVSEHETCAHQIHNGFYECIMDLPDDDSAKLWFMLEYGY
jgi:hypothetical protein